MPRLHAGRARRVLRRADPHENNLWVCNSNGGVIYRTIVTDANGVARTEYNGGGCRCLEMRYQVNATACGGPAILCSGFHGFCVKSPDMNGDGTVNFFDTFQYLPHLVAAHTCLGSPIPIVTCGLLCN